MSRDRQLEQTVGGSRPGAGTALMEAYKMHVAKQESKQFLRRLLLQKGLCGIYDMYVMRWETGDALARNTCCFCGV